MRISSLLNHNCILLKNEGRNKSRIIVLASMLRLQFLHFKPHLGQNILLVCLVLHFSLKLKICTSAAPSRCVVCLPQLLVLRLPIKIRHHAAILRRLRLPSEILEGPPPVMLVCWFRGSD